MSIVLNNLKLVRLILNKDPEKIREHLSSGHFDPAEFKSFAEEHLLAGYLYSFLQEQSLLELFPESLIEEFKNFYLRQWHKNERLTDEIKALNELFLRAGYDVLFLKGIFLAKHFYGDIDRRAISDIDILIKDNNRTLSGIEHLISKNGFRRESRIFLNRRLTTFFTHHFGYLKQDIALEVHWLLQNHFSYDIDYKRVWADRQEFSVKDSRIYVDSDENELLCQVLSVFTDIQTGSAIVKSLMDLYMILSSMEKELDWEDFFRKRKKEKLFLISLAILDLFLEMLDCRKEFDSLDGYINKNRKYVRSYSRERLAGLFGYKRFAFSNKLWCFRLYEAHPLKSFCWWVISLPFRTAVS